MNRTCHFVIASMIIPLLSSAAAQAKVTASWVEMVGSGSAAIRAVTTDASCPRVTIDGAPTAMDQRAPAEPDASKKTVPSTYFPLTCTLMLPAGAKSAVLDGRTLPLPAADPKLILVLGDTGCRIKGTTVQNCNDRKKWPFAAVAAAAAALKPDLVIHVGDYVYREGPCPAAEAKKCGGTPWGDNWDTWKTDFFKPAAPLLAAAPWAMVRGNHEICITREGAGYTRLIAVTPYGPCVDHLPAYAVSAGSQAVAVMDTSYGSDDAPPDPTGVAYFQKDYSDIKAIADGLGQPVWIATHRPTWGIVSDKAGGSANLIAAAGDLSVLNSASLLLAGHIHAFEALNYDAKVPPQIVAGHGGDKLDKKMPASFDGMLVPTTTMTVKTGLSVGGFGFLTMKRDGAGWSIRLYDSNGKKGMKCALQSGVLSCPAPK